MAITTVFPVLAATLMLVSSASLQTNSLDVSPTPDVTTTSGVFTTPDLSQTESMLKGEMNQCIDDLRLDEMYVIDITNHLYILGIEG